MRRSCHRPNRCRHSSRTHTPSRPSRYRRCTSRHPHLRGPCFGCARGDPGCLCSLLAGSFLCEYRGFFWLTSLEQVSHPRQTTSDVPRFRAFLGNSRDDVTNFDVISIFQTQDRIGLKEIVCGNIGTTTMASRLGCMIGPPADSEYAVEPVGEATMRPSERWS